MRGSSHRMIRWCGLSMEATRAIAFVANDAACSARCRLAAGRAIHSRMIARRALCSGIMLELLHQLGQGRFTNREARSVRTGLLDQRLSFAGLSCASCFSPRLGLRPRNLILSHQRSDLMFDGDGRRKLDPSSESVCAHWALPPSAFDCSLESLNRVSKKAGSAPGPSPALDDRLSASEVH